MTETLVILAPFTIRKCDLYGCERKAEFRLRSKHICEFHRMLLLHGRGLVEYLQQEAHREQDEAFGLNLEDEQELEIPGDDQIPSRTT